ncbi:conjugal transfer protein TrbE [uncultured Roseobacter sp.]|uniref:VirB4 family type IV secretion/conjugal transfer ATPase n=1 Tax=uncultured Roseobacter sp. TaxID=114847 RepID=UPI00261A0056|nr:conjugal transfer protein TrbE [uncultured Roseobacter sp.]
MGSLSRHRAKDQGFSDLLPYAAVVDRGIIANKDGSLMAAWAVKGPDLTSSTALERNAVAARFNGILNRLGSGFMIHMDAVRVASSGYPEADRSHFPDPISRLIDNERRRSFEQDHAHFETEMVLILTYLPPEITNSRLARAIYTDDTGKRQSAATKALWDFKASIVEVEDLLSNILQVRRLWAEETGDEHGTITMPDGFLSHIQQCITGRRHTVNLPPVPMYLDAIFGEDFHHGVLPKIGDRFIGVVAIDGFPQESMPGILASLDSLPLEYRWNNRFIFLDPVDAKSRLDSFRRKWKGQVRSMTAQVLDLKNSAENQDASKMVGDTDAALEEASSQIVTYGYYSANIVVFHKDPAVLEDQLAYVRRVVNNAGFVGRIETVNAVEAYLGSLPGNGYPNIRRPLINTFNLAHILPMNTVWAGREANPCPFYPDNSPPLMQVSSSGSTPFRFNLHVHDVGHTLIFGPTGSGKSTLLALIAAQFLRYPGAQLFCFDKGRSMLPLTLACGGQHYDIAAPDSPLLFCPLSTIETDADLAWAEDWIATMIQLQGLRVTPQVRNEIHRAMNLIRSSETDRSISSLIHTLQSKELREALQYYSIEGAMGQLLDSESDTLRDGDFLTFEMDDILELGETAAIPVLLYLFNRIERRLVNGRPSLIILDEAWMMLGSEVFREKIRAWLKVLRKSNCAVVMATQSLSDAMRSGIIDVLTESCPTKVLLPNPEAREETSQELYRTLGLNSRQIDIVSGAIPKRDYYVISPEGRRLFDMQLGAKTLSFVGASDPDSISRVRELHAKHGDDWTTHWLRERGL